MSPNERFEIKAAAFYRTAGLTAPGKDIRSYSQKEEIQRNDAWNDWLGSHGSIIDAVIDAMEDYYARNWNLP